MGELALPPGVPPTAHPRVTVVSVAGVPNGPHADPKPCRGVGSQTADGWVVIASTPVPASMSCGRAPFGSYTVQIPLMSSLVRASVLAL